MGIKLTNFKELSAIEAQDVLNWRNSDFVRFQMSNHDLISIEQHMEFIKSLNKNKDNEYYLVSKGKDRIGVIYLNSITEIDAELGLYKNPDTKIADAGRILMNSIFTLARYKKLDSLNLRVLKSNEKAIHLYNKFSFTIKNEDESFLYMVSTNLKPMHAA